MASMLHQEDWEKEEGMATVDQALVTKLGKPIQNMGTRGK